MKISKKIIACLLSVLFVASLVFVSSATVNNQDFENGNYDIVTTYDGNYDIVTFDDRTHVVKTTTMHYDYATGTDDFATGTDDFATGTDDFATGTDEFATETDSDSCGFFKNIINKIIEFFKRIFALIGLS